MNDERYGFKGVFIPAAVWKDHRLNALEMVLLTEIFYLSNGKTPCIASNQYLATFIKRDKRTAKRIVSKLEECGYIRTEVDRDDQRVVTQRRIFVDAALYHGVDTPSDKNVPTPRDKNVPTPSDKNVPYSNKRPFSNNKTILCENNKKESVERFEEFWQAYPSGYRKGGKKKARDIWKRKNLDKIADALIADVGLRAAKDRSWLDGYIPMTTTYLNQERWQDDIQTAGPKQKETAEDRRQARRKRIEERENKINGKIIEGEYHAEINKLV